MTGHRTLEKKQITQGNNRKVQNPSGSLKRQEEYNKSLIIKHYQGFVFLVGNRSS